MKRLWWVVCMLLTTAGAARAADLAVLPVAGVMRRDEREALTSRLRTEIAELGIGVLSTAETARVIRDAAAFGSECAVTVSACALQLGGIAGVQQVVVGAVDGGQLSLRLFDVASEQERGRTTVSVESQSATRLAVIRLLRPELDVGRIAIKSTSPGRRSPSTVTCAAGRRCRRSRSRRGAMTSTSPTPTTMARASSSMSSSSRRPPSTSSSRPDADPHRGSRGSRRSGPSSSLMCRHRRPTHSSVPC